MYLKHFGLRQMPFQLTPDARFYFDSRVHNQALSTFAFGLKKGEGFVVLTGEVGAGKTTLIELILDHLDADKLSIAKLNTSQLDPDNLIRYIALEFGCKLDGREKADALIQLRARLRELFDGGKLPLLIVDEVQALSPTALEELRMLSNMQTGNNPLLQILLIGQPEFRARMNDRSFEQLRQRVAVSYHLAGLSREDVEKYVTHRLKCAGWDGRTIFADGAMDAISNATAGNPRKINRLCDRLLFDAYLKSELGVSAGNVAEVVAGMEAEGLLDRPPERDDRPAGAAPGLHAEVGADVAREPIMLPPPPEPREGRVGIDQVIGLVDLVWRLRNEVFQLRQRVDRVAHRCGMVGDDQD